MDDTFLIFYGVTMSLKVPATEFAQLQPTDVDFGSTFCNALSWANLNVEEMNQLKHRAHDFMLKLYAQLQERMQDTLEKVQQMEPFQMPRFQHQPATARDLKGPYFNTHPVELGKVESQLRDVVGNTPQFALSVLGTEQATTASTEKFWLFVYNERVNGERRYKELGEGVIRMLTVPISNAEVERTFSQTNIVKTKLRSLIKTELLQNVMYIKFGLKLSNTKISDFKPPPHLIRWTTTIYGDIRQAAASAAQPAAPAAAAQPAAPAAAAASAAAPAEARRPARRPRPPAAPGRGPAPAAAPAAAGSSGPRPRSLMHSWALASSSRPRASPQELIDGDRDNSVIYSSDSD